MPSLTALSTRLAVMPEPGKAMTPFGRRLSSSSLRLIGNGMLALARHREQMQLLRQEPGGIRDAVNEMLRFDSPVQTDFRIAKAEIAVRGRTI